MSRGQEAGRGKRRARAAANDPTSLLAHICEVMGLFPAAGEQVLVELAGGMKTERRTGAAVQRGRRAGHSRKRR